MQYIIKKLLLQRVCGVIAIDRGKIAIGFGIIAKKTTDDKVKLLYDKIVQDYQCILFITHNSVYKEWANSIISVTKEKNISKISQNVKQLNVY
jgi:hypothetical protein